MRITGSGKGLVAVLLTCPVTIAAHAQDFSGPYIGIGAGFFNYEEQNEENGFLISDGATSYRIVGGYQLNEIYAIEASFGRSSDLEENFFIPVQTGSGVQFAPLTFGVEAEVKTLRFVAFAPVWGLSMFGSLGYYDADIEHSVTIDFPPDPFRETFTVSDNGVTVAGGIQYEWSRIALRGEYEWFDTDDSDTSSINVIAVFRF